jgi:hypothetical protein
MKLLPTIKKQSGKVRVESTINGTNPVPKLADTSFYQVGPHGDYQQEVN